MSPPVNVSLQRSVRGVQAGGNNGMQRSIAMQVQQNITVVPRNGKDMDHDVAIK